MAPFSVVLSGCPGSLGLFGLAGKSRELWKWLQPCPLSCQMGCDKQVGFVFMIDSPGVIAGEMLSKRMFGSIGTGGVK